jgi:hypothetical protein
MNSWLLSLLHTLCLVRFEGRKAVMKTLTPALVIEKKVADNDEICNYGNVHNSTVSANGLNQKQLDEDKVWNNCNA